MIVSMLQRVELGAEGRLTLTRLSLTRSALSLFASIAFGLTVFLVGVLLKPATAFAFHPFHVCIGQMRWNEFDKHWEVSLRMHPHDLELALQAIHGRSISLESDDFSQHARRFLENQFMLVTLPKGTSLDAAKDMVKGIPKTAIEDGKTPENQSHLRWVGMESERGWLWVHFELIPPAKVGVEEQLHLVHRVFLDRIEKQENSVAILAGKADGNGLDTDIALNARAGQQNRSSLQFKKEDVIRPMPVE